MKDKVPIVILGGGVGGLAVGWFLLRTGRYEVTVVERDQVIGGHCGSFVYDGFTLDHGPHKIYSVIPGVLDEIRTLMSGRLIEHKKRHSIYLNGRLLSYPLEMGNLARVLGPRHFAGLGMSYGISILKRLLPHTDPSSYEEYVVRRFGRGVYELVFEPLAWKVWGDPAILHPDMARTRIPSAGAGDLILTLLHLKQASSDTNAETFYYPRRGFGDLPQTMADYIAKRGGHILVNSQAIRLNRSDASITSVTIRSNGAIRTLPCRFLVSSLPLSLLGGLVYGEGDEDFVRTVGSLRFRHLVLVYVFINQPRILDDHWVFFPEREFLFSRVSEQKLMNVELGPPDRTVLCCDFTASEGDEVWSLTDDELATRCVSGLVKAGFVSAKDVQHCLVKRSENFYPVYDRSYEQSMKAVSEKLHGTENLLTTGRIGMYNYNNSDHCVDMGRFIADRLAKGASPPVIWTELERRVRSYRIVD